MDSDNPVRPRRGRARGCPTATFPKIQPEQSSQSSQSGQSQGGQPTQPSHSGLMQGIRPMQSSRVQGPQSLQPGQYRLMKQYAMQPARGFGAMAINPPTSIQPIRPSQSMRSLRQIPPRQFGPPNQQAPRPVLTPMKEGSGDGPGSMPGVQNYFHRFNFTLYIN